MHQECSNIEKEDSENTSTGMDIQEKEKENEDDEVEKKKEDGQVKNMQPNHSTSLYRTS